MASQLGKHAIVIGGSLTGLITARVLADYFTHVTILERDQIEDGAASHKSTPQSHFIHGLLVGGQRILSQLYPGFTEMLEQEGSVRCRITKEQAFYLEGGKSYSADNSLSEPRDLGIDWFCQSRGLLENCVRRFTVAYPNITFQTESAVQNLLYTDGAVHGVSYLKAGRTHVLEADLVVDAGGRAAQTPRWLAEFGLSVPEERSIKVDIGYACAQFNIPESYQEPDKVMLFIGAGDRTRMGGLVTIENKRWQVGLFGRFGDYPPTDRAGFMKFASELESPLMHEFIRDAEQVTETKHFRFHSSLQRHYERLTDFPDGLLVLGDAISSINPFYGQGITSVALQVMALNDTLAERFTQVSGLQGISRRFFPKVAEIVETPWLLAEMQDFVYPQTEGEKPADWQQRLEYFIDISALIVDDIEVHLLVADVFNLVKPLSALYEESLRQRVEHLRQIRGESAERLVIPPRWLNQ